MGLNGFGDGCEMLCLACEHTVSSLTVEPIIMSPPSSEEGKHLALLWFPIGVGVHRHLSVSASVITLCARLLNHCFIQLGCFNFL